MILAAPKSGQRTVFVLLRAAVSLSILAYVLSRISAEQLLARAKGAAYLELALVALLFVAMALLVALRWRLLACWLGLRVPARVAVRAVFLGLFGGQLLPSSIGSDVLRAWLVARQTGRAGAVAASVLVDRVTGFCGASLLIALAYGFVVTQGMPPPAVVAAAAATATALLVAALLAPASGRLRWLGGMGVRRGRPGSLLAAVGVALTIHAAATLAAALGAAAYGIDASPRVWLAVIPLSVIASALPVSINGWGVREAVIVAVAGAHGIAAADALLVALTLGLGNAVASLPGAFFWLHEPSHGAARS